MDPSRIGQPLKAVVEHLNCVEWRTQFSRKFRAKVERVGKVSRNFDVVYI